jgi:hypothetical protein
MWLT